MDNDQLPPAPIALPREGLPRMSPRARRRARELLVPLQALELPPEGRRITEKDVLAAAEADRVVDATAAARELAWQKGIVLHRVFAAGAHVEARDIEALPSVPLRLPAERTPLEPSRRAGAAGASYAQRLIPQFSVDMLALAEPVLELRRRLQREWGKREAPAVEDFFLRALALLLADEAFRLFRAVVDGDDIVLRGEIAVGFAAAGRSGTAFPVVHAADQKPLKRLAQITRELTARAQAGTLAPADQTGALVTLASLNAADVYDFRALVRPGEAAILTLPRPQPRPLWHGVGGAPDEIGPGMLATIEPTWQLTLSVDQRLVDGALGATFLRRLKETIEAPQRLV